MATKIQEIHSFKKDWLYNIIHNIKITLSVFQHITTIDNADKQQIKEAKPIFPRIINDDGDNKKTVAVKVSVVSFGDSFYSSKMVWLWAFDSIQF